MHRLLQRQIKKYYKENNPSPEFIALMDDISASYLSFDEDYKRLERILELSSQELFKANNIVNKEKDQIREELAESYKKYEEFDKAVTSSFCVSTTDVTGTILSVNQKFCKASGYSEKELVGKNHNILSSGYHTKKFWQQLWSTLRKGEIWNGEICNRRKNGEIYWEATNIIPFYNSHGDLYQLMAIKVDVTERKTAEEEIKRLSLVAQKTNNAIILIDTKGIATWANPAFERITGFSVEELVGKDPGELLRGSEPYTSLTIDAVTKLYQSIQEGVSFEGEIHGFKKSGQGYWAALNTTPMYDDDGILTGFIVIQSDISEKKRTDEELRVSEERWKYALSGNDDGVWDYNLVSGELFVSDSWKQMLGYQVSDPSPVMPDAWNIVHPDDRERALNLFEAYLSGKVENYRSEYRLQCKNGSYKWILDRGKIIQSTDGDGNPRSRFIGTHTDITAIKEAEEKEKIASLIVQNSPSILVRWKPNFKLNIEYITENISQLGYDAQEWIQSKVAFTDFVHPDDVKPTIQKVLQSFKEKVVRVSLRFRMRDSEGKYHWIDSDNSIEWDAKQSRAIHFQGIITDITEKVEAEQKLTESETRFRLLVQNSNDITTIIDAQGRTVYESPSFYRTFNYTEEDVIGKSIFEFIHPDDVQKAQYELAKGMERGGISDPIEFRLRHRNGSWVDVESIGSNLLNTPGINGIVINSRDITERKVAEENNKRLQDFYEVILNRIPTDIVVFDNKHRYLFVNEAAIRDPEKRAFIIGKDDYDYCEKYGRDKAVAHSRRAIFNKVAYNKQQIEFEEAIETPKGRIWVLRRMSPLLNDEGELVNMIGFGLDITERKMAEERLKESQERLSLAINAAKLGIWDWNLETGALLWDKEMYSLFNLNPNDFGGDYDAFEKTLHPEDKQRVFDGVQDTISGKQGDYADTFKVLGGGGEIKYVAAISKLYRNAIGKPIRMIGVNFDVTESKLAEQRILKSQMELEEAQHIARVGSWEIDMKTREVMWSKEMRTIHEVDEYFVPTLANVHLFYTEETREAIIEAVKVALHHKTPFDIESQVITAKGNLLDVKTKGVPVIEDGRVPYLKGVFQDISKEKEAERRLKEYTGDLERINKELDQFAYIVSHDLKAPLRAINNLSMWIEEDLEGKLEGETAHQFQLLRGRVSRLEDLINGILSYSRAGRIKVTPSKVDTEVLVNSIIEMLSPPPQYKITMHGKFPVLNTERIALEQVFSNLISNAIKYNGSNPEPVIDISCEDDGAWYKFGVGDNGQGIEPEYHEKIFVIFQTLEARDKVEGTGVGLAIVKKIVEEKDGRVWVESAKGQGAHFYFTWPKA
ncbi:MAG: PAS domain S-box protein [Bacteroidetes bacterium]|nr:MAG: PAS domain S-box protein [Bacteroidota bacterium]